MLFFGAIIPLAAPPPCCEGLGKGLNVTLREASKGDFFSNVFKIKYVFFRLSWQGCLEISDSEVYFPKY